METTENLEPVSPAPGIILNLEAQTYLREAGKWAGFLGIIGFIFCGFILIFSLTIGSLFSRIAESSPLPAMATIAAMSGFITVFYILIDLIYFFFSLYLYQFSSRIKKGIVFADNLYVTSAFNKLKSFFKLWGILTVIALCLYAVTIIGFIGIAIMRR